MSELDMRWFIDSLNVCVTFGASCLSVLHLLYTYCDATEQRDTWPKENDILLQYSS